MKFPFIFEFHCNQLFSIQERFFLYWIGRAYTLESQLLSISKQVLANAPAFLCNN